MPAGKEEEQLLQELEEIDDENQNSRTDEWWSAKIGRLTHVAEELSPVPTRVPGA